MTKGSAWTKAQLRAVGLVNSWHIAKAAGNRVFINYSNDTSRVGHGMRIQVVGIGFETAPDAAWYDRGCKIFQVLGIQKKALAVLMAQEWASLQGYTPAYAAWERDPFSGWHPKGTIARAMRPRRETP